VRWMCVWWVMGALLAAPADAARRGAGPRALVDVNVAGVDELARVPGVGQRLARALVDSRDREGPFRRPAELARVKGFGPVNAPRVARYLLFAEVGEGPGERFDEAPGRRPERPLDVNLATPEELAPLPGMGWALSYRVVGERERNGAFRTLDDLLYVRGVTAEHVRAWRAHLYVEREGP
jgi:DNA uptake protein ComE-like DNA-binding protein